MKVMLHSIERRDDGLIELRVSFGNALPKKYSASVDASEDKFVYGNCDEELFFGLSNAAQKRYGNCVVYHLEILGILRAFDRGDRLPTMPIEFGTTAFGRDFRPGLLRIVWNKFKILLYRTGICSPFIRTAVPMADDERAKRNEE